MNLNELYLRFIQNESDTENILFENLYARFQLIIRNKIIDEMDADPVSAWSKGGATDIKNCEMLCKTHNRAKGNK